MRGGEQKQGYTIVEVMIFLAVSGLMFVIAASFVNGKQAKSEFRQGMHDMNSQIQRTIDDVSNGFYPSNGNSACPYGVGGAKPLGENQGCTFLGKVMQFDINGAPTSQYNVYSVIGRQFKDDNGLIPPSNFNDAQPVVVGNITQTKNIEWGLELYRMTGGGTDIGAFGFFNGFATTTNNNLDSGSAAPITVVIPGIRLNDSTSGDLEDQVEGLTGTGNTNPDIVMCFRGEANQFGRLNIGTSDGVEGQKLSTHIQITSGAPSGGC